MSEIEQEQGTEKPDWLLDKFSTPEDQAKAYADAEREMQRLRSEREREREQFAAALSNIEELRVPEQQQQQQSPVYNPDQDPLLQSYQQALDMGDARALLAIQLELNRQMTQNAIQEGLKDLTGRVESQTEVDREVAITLATERVARRHDDWEQIAPDVGRLLQENSEWIPTKASVEAYEKAIGQAARIVKAEKVLTEQERSEQIRQEKLNAQGLTGDSARLLTPEDQSKAWDEIRNAKLTGYEGILRGSG